MQTSASKLITRLKDHGIQITIDGNGKEKTETSVSWDAILHAICNYVIFEAELLKKPSKLTDDTLSRKKKVLLFQKATEVHAIHRMYFTCS